MLVGSGASHQLFYQCHCMCVSIRWASVGFLAKSASARIRCKCTKKNGANDVSYPFFQTTLYIPALLTSSLPSVPKNSPTNPQKHTPFRPNPTAFSSFSSIFCNFTALFLSPQGEGKNLLARALCAHSDFSFFAFTSSPKPPNLLFHNTLRVKVSPQKSFTRSPPRFYTRHRCMFSSEKRDHTLTTCRQKGEHKTGVKPSPVSLYATTH